jgi:hypothetical protein
MRQPYDEPREMMNVGMDDAVLAFAKQSPEPTSEAERVALIQAARHHSSTQSFNLGGVSSRRGLGITEVKLELCAVDVPQHMHEPSLNATSTHRTNNVKHLDRLLTHASSPS